MEIEVHIRIMLLHLPHIFNYLQRIQDTQSVRQHITFDTGMLQSLHELKYIFGRVLHSVAPILQIDIDSNILFIGIAHHIDDILNMFFGTFLQLLRTVFQRTFAKQVDDAATGMLYPVHRSMAVYKSQHFHFMKQIAAGCPVADHLHGFKFTVRHTRRSNLYPVYF